MVVNIPQLYQVPEMAPGAHHDVSDSRPLIEPSQKDGKAPAACPACLQNPDNQLLFIRKPSSRLLIMD